MRRFNFIAGRRLALATPYLAILASLIILPSGTSFAKQLFPAVAAEGTSLYRVGFSALFLWAVWRPWRKSWSRKELLDVGVYGAVLGAMNLSYYVSLQTIPLGVATAIEFLGPLGLALFYSKKAHHFIWAFMAMIGLYLLLPFKQDVRSLNLVGIGFALAAGLFWALYIIYGQRASYLPAGMAVALGMTSATLVIAPFGLYSAGLSLFAPKLLFLGAIAALLSSTIPYSLEMIALRRIPKRVLGVLLALEPATSALAGMLFLEELLSLTQWLAIALIVTAGAGAVLSAGEAPTPKRSSPTHYS